MTSGTLTAYRIDGSSYQACPYDTDRDEEKRIRIAAQVGSKTTGFPEELEMLCAAIQSRSVPILYLEGWRIGARRSGSSLTVNVAIDGIIVLTFVAVAEQSDAEIAWETMLDRVEPHKAGAPRSSAPLAPWVVDHIWSHQAVIDCPELTLFPTALALSWVSYYPYLEIVLNDCERTGALCAHAADFFHRRAELMDLSQALAQLATDRAQKELLAKSARGRRRTVRRGTTFRQAVVTLEGAQYSLVPLLDQKASVVAAVDPTQVTLDPSPRETSRS